jgi:hypothetical protein
MVLNQYERIDLGSTSDNGKHEEEEDENRWSRRWKVIPGRGKKVSLYHTGQPTQATQFISMVGRYVCDFH